MLSKKGKGIFTNRGSLIDKGSIYVVVILTLLIFAGYIIVGGTLPTKLPSANSDLVQILNPDAMPTGLGLQLGYFSGVTPTAVPTKIPDIISPLMPFDPIIISCGGQINGPADPSMIWAIKVDSSAASGDTPAIKVFYTNKDALQLGSGAVSPMSSQPAASVVNPAIGDVNAKDVDNFSLYPALFITDVTSNPGAVTGDAQSGGTPNNPDYVYGTWKAAAAANPAPNGPPGTGISDRGLNADPWPGGNVAGGVRSYDFTSEIVWKISSLTAHNPSTNQQVALIPGNKYRIQAAIHSGANPSAVGVVCALVTIPDSDAPPPPPEEIPPIGPDTGDSGSPPEVPPPVPEI